MMGGSKLFCKDCNWHVETESDVKYNNKKQNLNTLSIIPPKIILAKADSGASQHFRRKGDQQCLTKIKPYFGPSVILPYADTLAPSKQGIINLSTSLSTNAQRATVLPKLKSTSLISLGQICDDKVTIVIDNKKSIAAKTKNIKITVTDSDIILKGTRNNWDRLYDILIKKKNV